jgi:hypothetical protein
MAIDAELTFGELRGFLNAFAMFNDKSDNGYSFSFERLPPAADACSAIERYFGEVLESVSATPMADWQQTIRRIVRQWLFEFQDASSTQHLSDQRKTFALSHDWGRERAVDWIVKEMVQLMGDPTAWKVEVRTKRFYECAWDDIVFISTDSVYFLHFGVSD